VAALGDIAADTVAAADIAPEGRAAAVGTAAVAAVGTAAVVAADIAAFADTAVAVVDRAVVVGTAVDPGRLERGMIGLVRLPKSSIGRQSDVTFLFSSRVCGFSPSPCTKWMRCLLRLDTGNSMKHYQSKKLWVSRNSILSDGAV
jgi:hypothetical protein